MEKFSERHQHIHHIQKHYNKIMWLLSKPQPDLNTTVGFYPTTPQKLNINNISARFWWNFKGRFLWTPRTESNCNGQWWHLSRQHLSISGISQLFLTWFWWNFKGSFTEPSLTDSDYQVEICPGNICPGDICPYQDYPSCYWPDVDQT